MVNAMARSSGYSSHLLLTALLPDHLFLTYRRILRFHELIDSRQLAQSVEDAFRREKLQVAVHKGDKPAPVPPAIFLLTYIEKPIIINSFHGAEGLQSVDLVYLLAGESPGLFLESNDIET